MGGRLRAVGGTLAVLCVVLFAGCAGSSDPTYAAGVVGQVPGQMPAARATQARLAIHNTGDAMPHLVLDTAQTGTIGAHWRITLISGDSGEPRNLGDGYYDFGPLAKGATLHVGMALIPKGLGRVRFAVGVYADVDSTLGQPTGQPVTGYTRMVSVVP